MAYFDDKFIYGEKSALKTELLFIAKTSFLETLKYLFPSCLRCGTQERLNIDHIIAICRKGSNDLSNLQILCNPCNLRKGLTETDYRPETHKQMLGQPRRLEIALTDIESNNYHIRTDSLTNRQLWLPTYSITKRHFVSVKANSNKFAFGDTVCGQDGFIITNPFIESRLEKCGKCLTIIELNKRKAEQSTYALSM